MKKSLILTLLGLAAMLTASAATPVLMPMPAKVAYGKGSFAVPATLQWRADVKCQAQADAFAACVQEIADAAGARQERVSTGDAPVQMLLSADSTAYASDEAYTLSVTPSAVTIRARATAGLYYGLITAVQLSAADKGKLPVAEISDCPRYGQRGVMIDVSRHFFPKEFIKKQIRAIAALKLNRLHLHLTDAAGWRIEIKSYPRLTQIAAWRLAENWKEWWTKKGRKYSVEGAPDAHGGYYTQDDIRELVAYAKAHCVTIVPELEMPAHSEETLVAYPELSCSGKPYASSDFCPGNEQVYTFWRNVLAEVAALFPGTEIHIGGDEASKAAWHTCPLCQAAMKRHHLPDVNALQSHFVQRISDIAKGIGAKITGWDDLMAGGAPVGSTVQVWGDISKAQHAVEAGNPVIISAAKYLYLDTYQDSPLASPEAIGGYLPVDNVYKLANVLDTLRFARPELVRGIEGCLWTEYVPTEQHLEEMIYPRLYAISEVAWGTTTDATAFRRRAEQYNHAMQAKGYTPFCLDTEVGQRPESRTQLKALSVGKPVTYNAPYNASYRANGDATLTDGLRGGWTYGDGRWQGFISADRLDVTIDLLRPTTIHSVAADFLQVAGAEVYTPLNVELLVSDDGTHFKPVWAEHREVDTTIPFSIVNQQWRGKEKARYVRLKALSGDKGGWIFTDEVVVK